MTTKVQKRYVSQAEDDQRLDKWFMHNFPWLKYGQIQKLIRSGQVRINGGRCKANTRLEMGQEIRVPPLPPQGEQEAKFSEKDRKEIESMILYQDDWMMALNKPAGLAVQGGSGVKKHIDGMLDALTDKQGNRPKLVHRLDRETSGVLLVAKNAKAAKKLGEMFKQHDMRKYYWAITVPTPEQHEGTIDAKIGKVAVSGGERIMANEEDGKIAITEYSVIDHAYKSAAFVAFWPRTGRTHQIRVHASLMGCPILGDFKYGYDDETLADAGLPDHVHLHARRLIFPHPSGNRKMVDITAPLSSIMQKAWAFFGFDKNDKSDPFEDIAT